MVPGELVGVREEVWGRKLLGRRELWAWTVNRSREGARRIGLHVDRMERAFVCRNGAAGGAVAIGCQPANAGLDRDLSACPLGRKTFS